MGNYGINVGDKLYCSRRGYLEVTETLEDCFYVESAAGRWEQKYYDIGRILFFSIQGYHNSKNPQYDPKWHQRFMETIYLSDLRAEGSAPDIDNQSDHEENNEANHSGECIEAADDSNYIEINEIEDLIELDDFLLENDSETFDNDITESRENEEEVTESWLDKHGINYLLHYTDITNLKSILDSGYLYSRATAEKENFDFCDGAWSDVIEKTNDWVKTYVRFFYKQGTPTLFRSEGIKPSNNRDEGHRPIPVALLFDTDIVHHSGVKFLNGSGSSKYTWSVDSFDEAYSFNWHEILGRGSYLKEPPAFGQDIKNHRNAEFLYPDRIGLQYLKSIVFRTDIDMQRAVIVCGSDERYKVDKEYFHYNNMSCNNYYLTDWNIDLSNGGSCAVHFNRSVKDYFTFHLLLVFKDGELRTLNVPNDNYSDAFVVNLDLSKIEKGLIRVIGFYMDDILVAIWENK